MKSTIELLELDRAFPFQILINDGSILTSPHWHREIELIYVTKGSISVGIDDVPYTLEEGEVALVSGGLIHYVVASPESERVVYQFDPTYFTSRDDETFELQKIMAKLQPVSSQWTTEQRTIVKTLLAQLKNEMTEQNFGYQLAVKAAVYQLLTNMVRGFPKQIQKAQPLRAENMIERLTLIFNYIETHYQTRISLEEIAHVAGYSPYHFTRFFKKNTGKTFLTFLNEYRIDKAKWHLMNSEDTVLEIILKTGFESDKTFYRLFRKLLGMSPLEYRQHIRNR